MDVTSKKDRKLLSVDELRKIVQSWDPDLSPDTREFKTGLAMLTVAYRSTGHGSLLRISRMTGVHYSLVRMIASGLRDFGLLTADGKTSADILEPEHQSAVSW